MTEPIEPPEPGGAEPEPGGAEPEPVGAPDEGRRYPSTIGGAFYLGVLIATGIGLAIVEWGSWRTGVRTIGGALIAAAVVRVVLRQHDAGMLAVRRKPIDALLLTLVGIALIVLASTIPDQPA